MTTTKKLTAYFKASREKGRASLEACGVKGNIDFWRMIDGQITIERYILSTYFLVQQV